MEQMLPWRPGAAKGKAPYIFEKIRLHSETNTGRKSREACMTIETVTEKNLTVAVVNSPAEIIIDVQSALDLMATVRYETGCNYIILHKEAISEDFFDLKTKLAGDILQKFVNYQMKIAIIGDFSMYTSKSLQDFIYESNQGKSILFMNSKKQAMERWTVNE
jgi:hypothetical protein